ncbi:TonB system transport protein ExbD [Campylobacter sp. faydin G-24]|uniref:Biopolymer transport protein ExbD n=1 Tax=Campylobacter anatolicus TaxID=2829105 RepID=A0ABS5HIX1_9BACT|nr:TonB system transport protein ExbD [Campylobacter anatolicus]MBR8461418.1 TonB system transport protein ExbD [Campylobacter anatolicus]MBR8464219.1 TonB system transport protein ExbD [Campylobacter anatolicus]MBR8466124.1 TonB system transport protein ExbD [Campylobacter anatolicus]
MKSYKHDGLNVVPFIDIMLVLLCIVLSVSTFIAQGKIEIELPQSESGVKEHKDDSISIVINDKDEIYFDDILVGEDEFETKFAQIDSKTLVILRSDKNSKFESFVKIIDALKMKKHENFAIATEIKQ